MPSVLSLDMSSHTGWCVLKDKKLIKFGLLEIPNPNPKGKFPINIYEWAEKNILGVIELIKNNPTDIIVIERTNLGRQRDSQSFLEYSHCLLWQQLRGLDLTSKIEYIDSTQWRKLIGLKMTDKDKENNKLITKSKQKVVKVNNIRIGRINKKHLVVRWANETFKQEFKLKHNDIADSIGVGTAYFLKNNY